jgi:type I restriction enzyme, S subunit
VTRTVALRDLLASLESGGRPRGGAVNGGEVPSIGAEHLGDSGGFAFGNMRYVPREFYGSMQRGRILPNDILLVKDGATTGKTSFVDESFPYSEASVNEHVFIVRVDPKRAHPQFVFHYLMSPMGQKEVLRDFRGATVGGITRGFADLVHIPVLSIPEQERLSAILSKADKIRRKRRETLSQVDQLIQSVFFRIVGPGASGYAGWARHKVQDLADGRTNSMRTGPFGSALRHSEFVDAGIAVLGIDNAVQNTFAWGQRRFITEEKYRECERYTAHPGDVIVTIMGTTGRSAVLPEDLPTAITTKHLACITLDRSQAEPEFVSNAVHRHPEVLRQLGVRQRGAIMNGLNLGIIKDIELPVPPPPIQQAFTRQLCSIRTLERRLLMASEQSDNLFNSLAQLAFRGEL